MDVPSTCLERDINESASTLATDTREITIESLRKKTRRLIGTLLNPIKVIKTDDGLSRDWRGLAGLCNLSYDDIDNITESSEPTEAVLRLWLENDSSGSTVGRLLGFLEQLDRYDVVDDVAALVDEDIKYYQTPRHKPTINLDGDEHILTIDDVARHRDGLGPQTYHAFVLFADADIDFASELIETMEKKYNLKLCVKDRDLVGGGLENNRIIQLITERCNRLIVILSTPFFESSANVFLLSCAQSWGLEYDKRKVIPCVYNYCKRPSYMICYFTLDYQRSGKLCDFWAKLKDSISVADDNNRVTETLRNEQSSQLVTKSVQQQQQISCSNNKSSCLKSVSSTKWVNSNVKFQTMDNNITTTNSDNIKQSTSDNNLTMISTENHRDTVKSKSLTKIILKKFIPKSSKKKKADKDALKQKVAVTVN